MEYLIELSQELSNKEVNSRALDSVVSSVFKVFEPDTAGEAQMAFDTLMVVLGFELKQEEYIQKIVDSLSGYEIANLAKTFISEAVYNHYHGVFKLEYSTSAQPLMKAMNETIEDSKQIIKEFEEANKTLKENLN